MSPFFPQLPSIDPRPTMLFLLFLLHLVTKNGSATLVALPLAPRTSTDICDDINNCRKFFDIVWGCLATIFACTWVSVHPNVPPLNQSWFALFWCRLKMMLVGIIVAEIMVGFAARRFSAAQMSSKEHSLSRTHGFFFCMGGFVTSTGYPVATKEQLKDPEYLEAIRSVDAEDIKDKSKGDALSKGVALAQSLWFTVQCLARMHQHLVVTELEVATLAFAVVNVFIWLLWWNKPPDVQRPMAVGPPVGPPKPLKERPITPAQISRVAQFFFSIFGTSETNDDYSPLSSTSVPSFWSPILDDNLQFVTVGITALAGSVFGAIHCAASNTDFPTTAEMWMWRSGSQVIAAMPAVGSVIANILAWIAIGAVLTYIPTRLILIPLPFAALRPLPQSAFVDVDWSTYIPHI
ncbi:hypothetical protein B0H14DRAFT_3448575 [Mycena olivaceomarginata]|nr:hypothetical protein B0H14DRAFT_3448575 [Mycena olivaceomarginata]